ncbi:MAG: nucleoside hydrolase [Candidatus Fermentithermobacillus carboniphilus]|uniref:Nucleoside hydrolase n=1 Tax=Candidatus Fermentithermobacillus carboniphilus TaxID=3085328 RepID=A0AAT9LDF2_9FIRM|nr:MAG: nucleoside hydrolase [Candidatus Fermentithermobacillus carboniphilus]
MKWVIDTDPGIDDAAAIIAAINLKIMDVVGITTVHGNVGLEHTTRNALKLVELLDSDVPVYRGASAPLLKAPENASQFHGEDGFGNTFLPEPKRNVEKTHAVDFLIQAAHRWDGDLSLLTLGPLTNVALAMAEDRSVQHKIRQIVMMGGTSKARGNTTPLAEFNIYADPEAAAIVFSSGVPIVMVPWETCLDAMLGPDVVAKVRESTSKAGVAFSKAMDLVVSRLHKVLGVEGLLLCDLVAACVAMEPSVVKEKVAARVVVETGGRYSKGLTVVDERMLDGVSPNTTVCLSCDKDRVGEMFLDALGVNHVNWRCSK